VGAIMADMDW